MEMNNDKEGMMARKTGCRRVLIFCLLAVLMPMVIPAQEKEASAAASGSLAWIRPGGPGQSHLLARP